MQPRSVSEPNKMSALSSRKFCIAGSMTRTGVLSEPIKETCNTSTTSCRVSTAGVLFFFQWLVDPFAKWTCRMGWQMTGFSWVVANCNDVAAQFCLQTCRQSRLYWLISTFLLMVRCLISIFSSKDTVSIFLLVFFPVLRCSALHAHELTVKVVVWKHTIFQVGTWNITTL